MLASLTLGALVLADRRPGPPLRRVAGRPGPIACVAAASALAVAFLMMAPTLLMTRGGPGFEVQLNAAWAHCGRQCGQVVAGAWLALALAGRWRPDRGWVDWMGRALGWAWLGFWGLDIAQYWILWAGW